MIAAAWATASAPPAMRNQRAERERRTSLGSNGFT